MGGGGAALRGISGWDRCCNEKPRRLPTVEQVSCHGGLSQEGPGVLMIDFGGFG